MGELLAHWLTESTNDKCLRLPRKMERASNLYSWATVCDMTIYHNGLDSDDRYDYQEGWRGDSQTQPHFNNRYHLKFTNWNILANGKILTVAYIYSKSQSPCPWMVNFDSYSKNRRRVELHHSPQIMITATADRDSRNHNAFHEWLTA